MKCLRGVLPGLLALLVVSLVLVLVAPGVIFADGPGQTPPPTHPGTIGGGAVLLLSLVTLATAMPTLTLF